ncbi:MAG: 30S ribosomal protein S18 [Candidatus Woykebacteria bacterium RIFCSPHIGHO2_01_FULL_39_12]|uniref:Small ribosomal subunit protein bS18 n=2 Tax=Candidatus Woykeibacteriota TaxID=1817899 RepID=A0A1G1WC55_9BACT|nr:MAG: 30S ribosomal protein S18 [Candidatus Woykebacteria bacterium RBG_16_39_9b]OGY27943.1 MAG: 30S ribosomal protein S18 [Candidatus Woykebacteria bacterium RIFCSPHIGHO2_01_FULL_39_12]
MALNTVYRKRFCLFCKENKTPNYKETETLTRFTTERGKILPRAKTGVCATHQRDLAREIKRARIMSLMPFTVTIK